MRRKKLFKLTPTCMYFFLGLQETEGKSSTLLIVIKYSE